MRNLLTALVLTALAFAADATSLKAHYGHYYATDYGDNTGSDIRALCGKQGVTGINYRARWRDIEPTEGNFVFTAWDNVVTTIQAMAAASGTGGSRIANNSCALWLLPEWKLFSAVGGSSNPCPSWLKDSNGNPGVAPNDQGSGTVALIATGAASVTNASPIVVTVASAAAMTTLNIANGDTVFVDHVAGNKAANGFWVVAGKTATTFQLTGSHGSGARVQSGTPLGWQGRVTKGADFDCKIWDTTVKAKFNALIAAIGAHFDGVANVEGFIVQETSISMANPSYNDKVSVGGNYDKDTYTTNLISYINACGAAFPASRCMMFINQIQDGGLTQFRQLSAALKALPDNQGCYSGPDILPNNSGLVAGTYQALIDHAGCRSDSAQNTTIVGSGAGAMACAATNCDEIFNFSVRGIFGTLGSVPLPADQGLCINSYLFWNDSVAEQAKVDGTIKKNPYGNQWYGQCSCGGAAP